MTPILLISDQTLPNLLFLKQFGPFERVVFVTTERMEKGGQSAWLIQVARLQAGQVMRLLIDPEQPASTLQALAGLNLPENESVLAFVSGGTKMMSLAAYAWASQRIHAKAIYLPIGSSVFLEIFPDAAEIPLTVEVSLHDYLAVHGVQVTGKGHWQPDVERARRVFNHVSGKKPDTLIGQKMLEARSKPNEIAFPTLTSVERAFYAGPWLEVWLAGEVKDLLGVPHDQIAVSLHINKSGPGTNMNNEFDVVFCWKNRLYAAECKHYTTPKGFGLDAISKELFKLAGINNLFGLNAKPFFAIMGALPKEPDGFREQLAILRLKQPAYLPTLQSRENLFTYLKNL